MSSDAIVVELAQAIAAVASGDLEQARVLVAAVHTRLVNRNAQAALPGVAAPAERTSVDEARKAAVVRVFAYWQEKCDHRQAKLTPERGRSIMARLRDGYSEAELRKAIDGAATAAYVNEDTGQRYDDLTLICRNGSKLESFIARGVKATGAIEVARPVGETSPLEDQIAELRRRMADLRKEGRDSEYNQAAAELQRLMQRRATS